MVWFFQLGTSIYGHGWIFHVGHKGGHGSFVASSPIRRKLQTEKQKHVLKEERPRFKWWSRYSCYIQIYVSYISHPNEKTQTSNTCHKLMVCSVVLPSTNRIKSAWQAAFFVSWSGWTIWKLGPFCPFWYQFTTSITGIFHTWHKPKPNPQNSPQRKPRWA